MHYKFSYSNPNTHFIHVEVRIDAITQPELVIHLPSWRPGRYEIANFSKNILNLKVTDNGDSSLKVSKNSKDSWVIQTEGRDSITVHYSYYAFAMDAGNSWLDEEQFYINFINCAIYADGFLNEPCTVSLDVPLDYKCATGLTQIDNHSFSAASYYQLVDSPLIASNSLRQIKYSVQDHDFNIWIQGDLPKTDQELIKDFERFTQVQVDAMGEFPCSDYHFLFQCLPYKHYHGVEHFNSTIITIGPSAELAERQRYKKLLGVSCHELFHTWNVIRLRPKEMVPYSFKEENYHKTGFITEGITTYYGDLFLVRSGVFSVSEYVEELNELFKKHYNNQGRRNMSVANSSYDLWLDGYESGIPGRKVSIYNEGALAALILDLLIRLKWTHTKSLDDVMRLMWREYGRNLNGYAEDDYRKCAEEIFGESLDEYFDDFIYGTSPFEKALRPLLETCGFTFTLMDAEKSEERNFGFRLSGNQIIQIATGSEAEELLSLKDKILKVNGQEFVKEQEFDGEISLEIERFAKIKMVQLNASSKSFFQVYQVEISDTGNHHLKKWFNQN